MDKKEENIMLILASFEKELEEKLQETKSDIERVKYYEKFQINGIDFKNIFITEEKDVDGNISYNVYGGNSSNKIISVNSEGEIEITPELQAYLGDINLEDVMEENEQEKGRLKGISEKASSEEMKNALKEQEEDTQVEEIEANSNEEVPDLEISAYRKIKDPHISERMPEVFKDGEENGIAFSNKLNRFVIISKVDGKYQVNENVEPARMTWETIISIDSNGESVEKKVPHALMQLPNNSEKEIAVTLDYYGDVSIETVDVLPCQERIARQVREDGEGIEKEESLEMRQEFQQQGKEYKHDIAHQVKEIEQAQRDENKTVDYNITPDDYIPNTEITWGELMKRTGESLPKLIERFNRDMDGKMVEDSEKVIEEIEYDYDNVGHEHKR